MKEKIFAKVSSQLEMRRRYAEAVAQRAAKAAFSYPEIKHADTALRLLDFEIVKEQSAGKDVSALNEQRARFQKSYDEALKSRGFSQSDFVPKYACARCNDTGIIGSQRCECAKKLFCAEARKFAGLEVKAPFKFSDCNFSIIADENQREYLKSVYKTAKLYCKKFDFKKPLNMLLSGPAGTGKTCVASAIANELVERGAAVLFVSAFEFMNDMRACHFSPPSARAELIDDYLTADLLVIDDLGVEQVYANITCEYLLLVLSEREIRGKSTVITTNLGDAIAERYGDRIASRLTDKNKTITKNLWGEDLRGRKH